MSNELDSCQFFSENFFYNYKIDGCIPKMHYSSYLQLHATPSPDACKPEFFPPWTAMDRANFLPLQAADSTEKIVENRS